MKKRLLFLVLFTMTNVFIINAQKYFDYFERYDWLGGFVLFNEEGFTLHNSGNHDTTIIDTSTSFDGSYFIPSIGIGLNLPIVKFNDDMSIGLNPTLTLSVGPGIALSLPSYVTFKYGTDASLDSEKDVGFTFGAGYHLTTFSGDYSEGFFTLPSIMGEINFTSDSYGLFKIRLLTCLSTKTVVKPYDYYEDSGGNTTYSIPFMVYFAVTPNF